MRSPNFVDKNIAKLAELFPNCVTEIRTTENTEENRKDKSNSVNSGSSVVKKAIDFDLLRQELSNNIVEGPQERYHLNWPGKREALLTANAPIAKTLRPCREESVDFDTTENLFIEGDNLDALKLLQETYLGKVKMIYIDPPYNTGKDFIYSDKFVESTEEYLLKSGQKNEEGNRLVANNESNGRFHSDWLSMMYSRLKLARNLLKDDGVIFISIDDNEFTNLRKLCDEVFGENNYLGTISNTNNPKGRSDDKFIATAHEYIAVYSKDINSATVYGFEPDEKIIKRYNKRDDHGKVFREIDLRKTGDSDKREDRPDMFYYFYYNEAENLLRVSKSKDKNANEIEIIPLKDDGSEGRWRWGYATAQGKIDAVYAKLMPSRKIWGIVEKDYLEGRPPVKSTSSWIFKDVNSERGSEQFIELGFGKEVFQRPKPIGTLKRCIEVGTVPHEESLVLDFFAGSSGIAQAVFELNSTQKRNLKLIAVQLPEECDEKSEAYKLLKSINRPANIAEISKERIRRAGKKIKEQLLKENLKKSDSNQKDDLFSYSSDSSSSSVVKKDLDIGFRVLKVDSSNMADIYYAPDETNQGDWFIDNIKEDRTAEDLLFQVLLDWGVDLTLPITREIITTKDTKEHEKEFEVFFVDKNALAACFVKNGQITEDFCKELAKRKPLRVVFRDSGFQDDSIKINVEQIFKLMSPHTEVKCI